MSQLWDRDYLERRVARSKWLADKATLVDVRQMHIRFAQHYQRIIDALSRTDGCRPIGEARLVLRLR